MTHTADHIDSVDVEMTARPGGNDEQEQALQELDACLAERAEAMAELAQAKVDRWQARLDAARDTRATGTAKPDWIVQEEPPAGGPHETLRTAALSRADAAVERARRAAERAEAAARRALAAQARLDALHA